MMITIHGFPAKTKYQDVKILIKQECSINDFILDNLVNDTDGTKKVRIGLTDNTEGYKVMKCLDGYRMPGNFVLKAIPIGKATSSQPQQPSGFDSRPSYQNQPRNEYSNTARNEYLSQPSNDYNNQGSHGTAPPHSHGGIHGSSGVHGSVGSHASRPSQGGPHSGLHASGGSQGSIDSMNRPSPWVSGDGNSSQWNAPMAAQVPQNTFGFTSPPANVNPSYGQQQAHPRPSFNQGRADQGYGYTPKSNVPEVVPANSRYRWVRKSEQEPTAPKSPNNDEDSSSADDNLDEKSQDVPKESEKDPGCELLPSETARSNKARKRERAKMRNISKLNGSKRRRLFFWLKQGKSFIEARKLCKIRVKQIPEYPALKAEQKKEAREIALRRMSPERQARAIKLERFKGRGIPGAPAEPRPPCKPIRVRFVDELGCMSQENIEMLEDKILELVDAETDENRPSFVGCAAPCGSLLLSCVNEHTVEWLENHLPDFQLWEGAQVKIMNLGQFYKANIGIAYIPDPNLDDSAILTMLKSQNVGIDFSDWWITGATPDLPAGQTVTFTIDDASVEKLAERNNYVYLGHKKIKIRIKSTKKKAPPVQDVLAKEEAEGKMNTLPTKGQQSNPPTKGQQSKPRTKGQQSKPPKGQQGIPPKGQQGIPHKGQQRMPPKGQNGNPPKGQRGMPSKGQQGFPPKWQRGMQPMGQWGMPPMGQWGMPPMGQWGMPPMDQMGMMPMGQCGMMPMDYMTMGPMNMGQMRPMDMWKMGLINQGDMGPMGFVPTDPSDFSQPGYYEGRQTQENRQIQGGPRNNRRRNSKRNKKKHCY